MSRWLETASIWVILAASVLISVQGTPSCDDFPPSDDFTCLQQKEWGKCNDAWMIEGGYCRKTCGRQSPLGSNVLNNAGAEAGSCIPGGQEGLYAVPCWEGKAAVVCYDPNDPSLAPKVADGNGRDSGRALFTGGWSMETQKLTQDVDLSPYTGWIAGNTAGDRLGYTFSALLGGFIWQEDHVDCVLAFLDSDKKPIEPSVSLTVSAADRNGVTSVLPRSAEGNVPPSASYARVSLFFKWSEKLQNNAYADNVNLAFFPTVPKTQKPSGESTRARVCDDIAPPLQHPLSLCTQQRRWGKCMDDWLIKGGYCRRTCGLCKATCDDVPPNSDFTCEQQQSWGKCDEQWMMDGGFCRQTCGLDPC